MEKRKFKQREASSGSDCSSANGYIILLKNSRRNLFFAYSFVFRV